ncbi:hypothetical protein K1719_021383 [Acacia pycnantha]|nr:hypothetical protein K1719_021383 [Acacia pycnantha]
MMKRIENMDKRYTLQFHRIDERNLRREPKSTGYAHRDDKRGNMADKRMMNKVFENQIGHNIEVYIDDMIVKSCDPNDHIRDLEQTFSKLRAHQIG